MTKKITAVAGVDIFLQARLGEELPAKIGGFTLKHVSSRGTVTNASSKTDILDVGWVCARYLLDDKAASAAKLDSEITTLITELGRGREWSSLIKLYEIDGQKSYS